ncbi:MAG: A/G-specific adenine glycosylase [Flavobacteriales bacterium]
MQQIRTEIIKWYEVNKRSLPWRETKDPYFIWLSEIILQQTRVDQGMSYYLKFIQAFPTVFDLAKADEQVVLNLWQGLGYYSRARNLHRTAKQVVEEYEGKFPSTYDGLLKLKGVGPYTAAAISSFSFDLAHAVVDGNVFRVLSRIYNWSVPINSTQGKKDFEQFAQELLDQQNPGLFNQAIMEFGALHCKPTQPLCEQCPVAIHCLGFQEQKIDQLPIKLKKQRIRERFFVFEVLQKADGSVLLEQRTEKDIWQHLYQFPLKEFESKEEKEAYLSAVPSIFTSQEYKHVLSHQHLYCHFILRNAHKSDAGVFVQWEDFHQYPIPRVIDRFLDEHAQHIFNNKAR